MEEIFVLEKYTKYIKVMAGEVMFEDTSFTLLKKISYPVVWKLSYYSTSYNGDEIMIFIISLKVESLLLKNIHILRQLRGLPL